MTNCLNCNTFIDSEKQIKLFCNQNCLNHYINQYINENLDDIVQEYRDYIKQMVNERY